MDLLIDTNVLYFLAGLEQSNHDFGRVTSVISKFENVYISELTVLDMLSKYSYSKAKILSAENYIASHNIKVHQILSDEDTIVLKANDPKIVTSDFFNSIVVEATGLKIKIETEFITYWFSSVPGILLMVLYRLNKDIEDSMEKLIVEQFGSLISTMKAENGYFKNKVRELLENFYYKEKRSFNYQINALLLEVVEVFDTTYEAAKLRVAFLEFGQDPSKYKPILDQIVQHSRIAEHIQRKKNGEEITIIDKAHWGELSDAIASYLTNSKGHADYFLLQYSAIIFWKYLTESKYRIKKNDIFDSIIVRYCNDFVVLTFDKKLNATIRSLDMNRKEAYEMLGGCV